MSTGISTPEPDPDAEVPRPLATPASSPARQADMTDEEIESAFAALWRKLERCDD